MSDWKRLYYWVTSVTLAGCGLALVSLSEYPDVAQPMFGGAIVWLGWSIRPRRI